MKYIALIALLLSPLAGTAQNKERVSPVGVATARHQDAYIKIIYGRPSKKGREIFGNLVPFGRVWRTGANEATEITTTTDIKMNGELLKKGNYSMFTIPNPDKWTIIFNTELGQWGSYNYNEKKDALRFDVPVQTVADVVETFTIQIEDNADSANIVLVWDKTKVSFPVEYMDDAD